ncbi:MAG: efflux RND transporter periplasmic adaptor subunit [Candidatus Melainabacteria bacterium]
MLKTLPFLTSKRFWLGLAGVLGVMLILGFVWFKTKPDEVDALELRRSDFLASLTITGEVRADQTTNLGAPATARITEIAVDEGDAVLKGQLLVRMEQGAVQAQAAQARANVAVSQAALADLRQWRRQEEITQLGARVEEARQALAQANAQMKSAQTQSGLDTATRARYEKLYQQEFISRQELDEVTSRAGASSENTAAVRAQQQQAAARLKQAQADLAIARNGPTAPAISQASANVRSAQGAAEAAQSELDQRNIHAGFSGVVTARFHEPGDMVTAGQSILQLAAPDSMEVVAFVEEADIADIQLRQKAYVVLDAHPDTVLTGQVVRRGSRVNPENGTVEVTIRFTADALNNFSLLPGMTCDVNILRGELKNVLVVPTMAVRNVDGVTQVYRFDGNHLKPVTVTIRKITADRVEILSGVAAGDRIAAVARPGLLEKRSVAPHVIEAAETDNATGTKKKQKGL